jgi:spermidine synthase
VVALASAVHETQGSEPVVSARFEELDWRPTPLGTISLRRRLDPVLGADVYEVKLDDEFLMSSVFTEAEIQVAGLALAELTGTDLDVVVGGLGLGYTAQRVLDDARVRSLIVVDAIAEVIEWHERGLVPVSVSSGSDDRCQLVHGDFFAMVSDGGFDTAHADRRFDAIIVDIDHSPRHVLNAGNAAFYEPSGVAQLMARLHPGGIFSLWSNDPPDDEYLEVLRTVFVDVRADVVSFHNPLQDRASTNTVYLARRPATA